MRLKVAEARALAERALRKVGHDARDAALVADHLIDCELRGIGYGGLARAVTIIERFERLGDRRRPMRTLRETPVSALIDGGDQLGYLAARRATELAIAKAKAAGIAMVGANDNWLSGMLSYYGEMVTREGLVAIMTSHAGPWVAPHGSTQGLFGTNPMCVAFPSSDDPIIWDIGTSAIMHAEVTLAKRLGRSLPEGVAFDAEGRPTSDPAAAFAGAFAAWGGYKGSGLGLMVQLFGIMCGGPALPKNDLSEFAFFIVAMDPGRFGDLEAFKKNVADYAETVRRSRPVAGGPPVRMPFDRSAAERRLRLAEDAIEVEDTVHARLLAYVGG